MHRNILLAICMAAASGLAVFGQDSPPLGDVARQVRQQKQDKDAQSNIDGSATKTKKVITNDQISSGSLTSDDPGPAGAHPVANPASPPTEAKQPAEFWRSQIQAQKQSVATLEAEISRVNDSIQFAPANCVSGCVQWNEQQQKKQQDVERMRSQLDTLKQQLQASQEAARQQGYGSSIYDP